MWHSSIDWPDCHLINFFFRSCAIKIFPWSCATEVPYWATSASTSVSTFWPVKHAELYLVDVLFYTILSHSILLCTMLFIFTSQVSRRGNIFGSVCLCVCLFALKRLTGWIYEPRIWRTHQQIKDLHISKRCEGEGHRSTVRVTEVKNVKVVPGQDH